MPVRFPNLIIRVHRDSSTGRDPGSLRAIPPLVFRIHGINFRGEALGDDLAADFLGRGDLSLLLGKLPVAAR